MLRLVSSRIIATCVMVACNVLSSCSPYVYSSDVTKLNTETSSIDASNQQTASTIADQTYQNNRYEWIQQRRPLTIGPGCSLNNTGSVACEVVSGVPGPVVAPGSAAVLKYPSKTVSSARTTNVCETSDGVTPANPTSSQAKEKPTTA